MDNGRTMTPADFEEKWLARLLLLGRNGLALEAEERARGIYSTYKASFDLPDKLRKMLSELKADYEAVRVYLKKPESKPDVPARRGIT